VLTAALDAARLGALAPLSADLLRAAAPGYCTPRQQAEAPGNWFERALAYATERLHGAASALAPAGSGMGQVAGYTVADYLIQHATRERRVRVPASTWDALLAHVRDPADAVRLADSANRRLLYRYASALYSYAADAGEENALPKLAYLRGRCGELDEAVRILRGPADSGDKLASVLLTDLLVQHGKLDELRALADGGNEAAAIRLIILLANQEDLDELGARADGGDYAADLQLTSVLIERGDLDELRARADGGNIMAQIQLVRLLGQREDLDELRDRANGDEPGSILAQTQLDELLAGPEELDELRARADTGDAGAVQQLARTLTRRGDVDGAAQLLHAHADGGDKLAARQLVSLLADHGRLDELRARADGGDETAAWRLAELLRKRGDLDELRARASSGDADSVGHLADLLSERGELDEALQVLHAAADAGRVDIKQLADLLAKQGQPQKAEQLRRFGLNPDGSIACE
jgi:hypothetical protein